MRVLTIACALLLTGCAMTPTQKKVAYVVGGALVIGAVIAHTSGDANKAATSISGLPIDEMTPANPKSCQTRPGKGDPSVYIVC